jgi:probable F420-dependent oxidoreductase
VKFGIAFFPTAYAIPPAELARLTEERGFESLFFTEHTHIPASRETPDPAGGDQPREYSNTYDPFVALAQAAAVTTTLKVGTGICLVIERDPIITAKEVASIDQLSGGRMLFGIGAGWNREEMRNHGTDPDTRFGRMRECVEAMRAIWTQDEATYHGKHVNFDRIWCWPKPAQEGGPPVLIGGNAEKTLDRVVRYGDEYLPNRVAPDEYMLEVFKNLQRKAEAAGRDTIPITLYGIPRKPERIELLASGEGVHRLVWWLPSTTRDEIEPRVDERAALVEQLFGSAPA